MSGRSSTPHGPPLPGAADDNVATPSAAHHQQQWPVEVVVVRQVTADNLVEELCTIRAHLKSYPYITVHAEHHGFGGGDDEEGEGNNALPPGVRIDDLPAAARYRLAKIDVDSIPYSQLGITLCDGNGRLPLLPAGAAATPWSPVPTAPTVWQFSLHHHHHSDDSRSRSVVIGGGGGGGGGGVGRTSVSVRALSHALFATGIVSAENRGAVTWIAYGGLYHLGFLHRILAGGGAAPLPETKEEFLASLRTYLGDRVFDARYVAAAALPRGVSLKGTLMQVASLLGAPAATAAREPWQAGERSLVACQVFMLLKGLFFAWDSIDVHAGCIHGLHSPSLTPSTSST